MSQNMEIVRTMYKAFAQRDGVTPFEHTHPTSNGNTVTRDSSVAPPCITGMTESMRFSRIFSRPFASLSFKWWS